MLLIWMSLSGTIPLVIFIVTWLLQKEHFDIVLGKTLLFMSMIFYLIPFPLTYRLLPEETFQLVEPEPMLKLRIIYNSENLVPIKDGFTWLPEWISTAFILWFIIILSFSLYQFIKYRQSVNYLLSGAQQGEFNIDGFGTVSVIYNSSVKAPYTMGFIRTYMVFPDAKLNQKHLEMLYKHESHHAKCHDSLIKLLCLIVMCIHWFNPFAILLLFFFSLTSEYSSDAYATKGYTLSERKEYSSLLIEMSSNNSLPIPVVWRNNFPCAKLLLKRRITYIMKEKTSSHFQKIVAITISFTAVLLSSLTVLAYSPYQSSDTALATGLAEGDYLNFVQSENSSSYFSDDIEIDFSLSDTIFISNSEEAIPIYEDQHLDVYAICNHTFISGTIYKHVSNGSGGCTVYVYEGQQCSKCNYIKSTKLINTIKYSVCTHK